MSKHIGEVAGFPIEAALLTKGRPGLVTVLASRGGVELNGEPSDLHPEQARYLADLLRQAADESERMKAAPTDHTVKRDLDHFRR